MLGTFLLILQQIRLERFIFLLRPSARPRTGDGPGFHPVALYFHQRFWRSAYNNFLAHFKIIHIRGRIHRTQHPVYMQGIHFSFDMEALG
ncbi:hypothetical protein D3C77_336980 [compost metagenome]